MAILRQKNSKNIAKILLSLKSLAIKYKENKDDAYIHFIDKIVKDIKNPKNKGKGYYYSRLGQIDF